MSKKPKSRAFKRIFSAAVAVLTVFCSFAASATEESKSYKIRDNVFYPAKITNAVDENSDSNTDPESEKELEWTPSDDTYTAQKQVKIVNVDNDDENNTSAYIRVCIVPRWVTEVGGAAVDVTTNTEFKPFGELTAITVSGSTYTMGDVTFTLDGSWNENWFFNSVDGYFYCKKAVKPGDSTPLLLASLSVDKTKKDTTYKDVTLEVDIISDSIQTGGGAVSARWGASKITIDSNGALAPQTQS